MSIEAISGVRAAAQGFTQTQAAAPKGEGSFANILSQAIEGIVETESAASESGMALLSGESGDLHTGLIAALKAETAVSYAVEIRNRVLEAYNNVMNMQV